MRVFVVCALSQAMIKQYWWLRGQAFHIVVAIAAFNIPERGVAAALNAAKHVATFL